MFCARGAARIKAGGSFKNNTHRRRTRVTFGKTAAVLSAHKLFHFVIILRRRVQHHHHQLHARGEERDEKSLSGSGAPPNLYIYTQRT
jgi:hypothetical protein